MSPNPVSSSNTKIGVPMSKSLSVLLARKAANEKRDDEACNYQDLLATSVPDNHSNVSYTGAPIGYSVKITKHTTSMGLVTENVVAGNIVAPRPRYVVRCESESCALCHDRNFGCSTTSMWSRYSKPPSRSGGVSLTEYLSPQSTSLADIDELERKAELGIY